MGPTGESPVVKPNSSSDGTKLYASIRQEDGENISAYIHRFERLVAHLDANKYTMAMAHADSNTGYRANGGVTRLEAEISALTQLNVRLPDNYFSGSDAVGTYQQTRNGPYFDPSHLK